MVEEEKKLTLPTTLNKNGAAKTSLTNSIQNAEIETPVFKAAELKEVDLLIKKVNNRLEKERKAGKKRKIQAEAAPLKVKIYMKDGNIFTGFVIRETNSQLILKTSIGKITIDKKKISRRIYL